jgi:FixJ family two-component response regulator
VKQLPKVFVIDDEPAVLGSIEALLTAQSYDVDCFASAHEFIAQNDSSQVGCLVVDFSTLGIGGSELIRHLHETRSLLSVVVISGLIEATVLYRQEKGQVPILAKPYEVWTLIRMIEDAIAGSLRRDLAVEHTVSIQVDWLQHYALAREKILRLSPRQREVMSLLLAGESVKVIAQKLGLSKHTVVDYVKRIYKHFSVSSRPALLAQFIAGDQP